LSLLAWRRGEGEKSHLQRSLFTLELEEWSMKEGRRGLAGQSGSGVLIFVPRFPRWSTIVPRPPSIYTCTLLLQSSINHQIHTATSLSLHTPHTTINNGIRTTLYTKMTLTQVWSTTPQITLWSLLFWILLPLIKIRIKYVLIFYSLQILFFFSLMFFFFF
jgi:hypothetical protein